MRKKNWIHIYIFSIPKNKPNTFTPRTSINNVQYVVFKPIKQNCCYQKYFNQYPRGFFIISRLEANCFTVNYFPRYLKEKKFHIYLLT